MDMKWLNIGAVFILIVVALMILGLGEWILSEGMLIWQMWIDCCEDGAALKHIFLGMGILNFLFLQRIYRVIMLVM